MPVGSVCGIVLLLYIARRFSSSCVFISYSSCTASDLLLLKLLEFLR